MEQAEQTAAYTSRIMESYAEFWVSVFKALGFAKG